MKVTSDTTLSHKKSCLIFLIILKQSLTMSLNLRLHTLMDETTFVYVDVYKRLMRLSLNLRLHTLTVF